MAPIMLVADERPVPGNGVAPDGVPITGDLSNLRPSERLRGSQQALRAQFHQQMQTGARPWLAPYSNSGE